MFNGHMLYINRVLPVDAQILLVRGDIRGDTMSFCNVKGGHVTAWGTPGDLAVMAVGQKTRGSLIH